MSEPDRLSMLAFEVQLYLADRHNLSAAETAIVFIGALGDTIAFGLSPDSTVDEAVDAMVDELRRVTQFRVANPPAMGLREMIAEYKRAGGKVRVS